MKTSVIVFRRGEKKITLVGCSHLGSVRYYDKLKITCDANDVVFYEKIVGQKNKNIESHKTTQGQILAVLQETRTDQLMLQHDFKYPRDWIRADIDLKTLQLISPGLVGELGNVQIPNKATLKLAVKFLPLIMKAYNIRKGEMVVNYRNAICISHLVKQLPKHNSFAILYGEAHLKKFKEQFKAMGFVETLNYKMETGI